MKGPDERGKLTKLSFGVSLKIVCLAGWLVGVID